VRRAAGLLAAALLGAVARPASAQGVASCPLRPADRGCVEISSVFSASPAGDEVSALHFSPQLAAGVRFARRFSATLDVTAASTSVAVYGEDRRRTNRIGNPILGLHYAPLETATAFVRAGVVFGPPLVTVPGTIPTNVVAQYGDGVSVAARGFAGSWLWARNAVPVALVLRAEARFRSGIVVGAGIEPGVLVSVNSAPSRVALFADASVAYRIGPFSPGLRAQVFASSYHLAAGDFAQVSLAPFARLDLGRAFLRAEVDVNLDGPQGLAGSTGATVWGASVGGGVRF
jgi:hypothetical protein